MTRGLASFVKDNLEAFAVAIALALVVRHYCLEAFRIPSNSMMPTLLGDDSHPGRGGDRILVDKFAFLRRDPRRWEPVVFQYPLNRSKNFIKRLVGLPEEWLRIVDGDIWTSRDEGRTWTIARKPAGVQDSLFFRYYPEPAEKPAYFSGRACWEGEAGWVPRERERRFSVDTKEAATLRFLPLLLPYDSDGLFGDEAFRGSGGDAERMTTVGGDVRVSFRLAVERAGSLAVVLTEHGFSHRLVLAAKGSHAIVMRPGRREHRTPVDVRLEAGGEYDVSFANVDDTLHVEVGGDAAARLSIEFPEPSPEPDEPHIFDGGNYRRHGIAIEAEGAKAALADLRVDRDLHYSADYDEPKRVFKIPADSYLMLGDNTRRSSDSRRWRVATVLLKDGRTVVWEESQRDVPGQPYAEFGHLDEDDVIEVKADVDGLVRRFRKRDVADVKREVAAEFVSRDHLVGRAFAIFWPIYLGPVYPGPTRVGFIR